MLPIDAQSFGLFYLWIVMFGFFGHFFLCAGFFFVSVMVHAQIPFSFSFSDTFPVSLQRYLPKSAKDSSTAAEQLRLFVSSCRASGYLSASVDQFLQEENGWLVSVFMGPRLTNWELSLSGITPEEAKSIFGKYEAKGIVRIPVDETAVMAFKMTRYFADRGYPFVETIQDIVDSSGVVNWIVKKHALFLWDTLDILPAPKRIRKSFLMAYLQMQPGKTYRESTFRDADRRMKALDYLEVVQPAALVLASDKARPLFHLRDRKVNRLDLLIGLLPNTAGQKLLVTGQALIHLKSILGRGEEFMLKWQKLQPATQQLDVVIHYPYLFRLPFGISAQFGLYKADSSWLSIEGEYGFRWLFAGNNFIHTGVRQQACWVTKADTSFILREKRLPDRLDFSSVEFQLGWLLQQLDYFFNPRKGFDWRGNIQAGVKQIKRSNQIVSLTNPENGMSFDQLYDSFPRRMITASIQTNFSFFQPLAKQWTLRSSIEGGFIYSPRVTRAELFRIGGLLSFRGFDEQSLFTQGYALWTEDIRWLFSKNGYFYAGMQAAILPHNGSRSLPVDIPFSISAGTSLDTKVGIFSLGYAVGKPMDKQMSFRSSKIHFGYINLF